MKETGLDNRLRDEAPQKTGERFSKIAAIRSTRTFRDSFRGFRQMRS